MSPEGFFSTGKELKDGELEHAAIWAKGLVKYVLSRNKNPSVSPFAKRRVSIPPL